MILLRPESGTARRLPSRMGSNGAKAKEVKPAKLFTCRQKCIQALVIDVVVACHALRLSRGHLPDQGRRPNLYGFFQMSLLCRYSALVHAASCAICRSTTSRAIRLAISRVHVTGA